MANNQDFKGFSIYKDERGRNFYYDFFSKRSYLINKSDMTTYSKYAAFRTLSIITAVLLYAVFSIKLSICLIIGILLFIACEICFRILFIYKLPSIDSKKIKRNNYIDAINERLSIPRILISIILSLILIGITINSAINNKHEIGVLIGCSIVVAISLFIFISCIFALIKRNK